MNNSFLGNSNSRSHYDGEAVLVTDGQGNVVSAVGGMVLDVDFLGASLDPRLTALDTAGGTETTVTAEPNGVFSFALSNSDEVQKAGFSTGDTLILQPTKGLIVNYRFKVKVLPTTGTEKTILVMGVASAEATDPDAITNSAWFRLDSDNGSGATLTFETDDGTHETSKVSTGITLTADDRYRNARIDFTNMSDVKVYVDDIRVCSDTTFNLSSWTAAAQPLSKVLKAKSVANTGTGTLYVDRFVSVQNRR